MTKKEMVAEMLELMGWTQSSDEWYIKKANRLSKAYINKLYDFYINSEDKRKGAYFALCLIYKAD